MIPIITKIIVTITIIIKGKRRKNSMRRKRPTEGVRVERGKSTVCGKQCLLRAGIKRKKERKKHRKGITTN